MSTTMSDKAVPISRARKKAPAPLSRRRNRTALLFLLPGALLFSIYVIYPVISSIVLSFYSWDGMTAKTFVGLANYQELVHSDTFYTALKNNVIWLVLFLLAPPFGLAFALYLNQNVRGIRLAKSLFFAPFVLPGVVVGLASALAVAGAYGAQGLNRLVTASPLMKRNLTRHGNGVAPFVEQMRRGGRYVKHLSVARANLCRARRFCDQWPLAGLIEVHIRDFAELLGECHFACQREAVLIGLRRGQREMLRTHAERDTRTRLQRRFHEAPG